MMHEKDEGRPSELKHINLSPPRTEQNTSHCQLGVRHRRQALHPVFRSNLQRSGFALRIVLRCPFLSTQISDFVVLIAHAIKCFVYIWQDWLSHVHREASKVALMMRSIG